MITLLSWKYSVFFKALSPRGIPADWSSCCFCYKPHCQQNTGWIPFHFLDFLIITMNILDQVPVQYVTLLYFFSFLGSFYILLRDFPRETLTSYSLPPYLNTIEVTGLCATSSQEYPCHSQLHGDSTCLLSSPASQPSEGTGAWQAIFVPFSKFHSVRILPHGAFPCESEAS